MAKTFLEREADAAERLAPALREVRKETEGLAGGMQRVNREASTRVGEATTGRALTGPQTLRDRGRGASRGAEGGSGGGGLTTTGRWVRGPGGAMIWVRDDPSSAVNLSRGTGGGSEGGGFQRLGGGDPNALLARSLQRAAFNLVNNVGGAASGSPGGGGPPPDTPMQRAQLEATGAIVSELRALRRDLTRGISPGSLARSR